MPFNEVETYEVLSVKVGFLHLVCCNRDVIYSLLKSAPPQPEKVNLRFPDYRRSTCDNNKLLHADEATGSRDQCRQKPRRNIKQFQAPVRRESSAVD